MKLITRTNLIGALGVVIAAGGCATSTSDEGATSSVRGSVTHETGSERAQTPPQQGQMGERGQMSGSGTVGQQQAEHGGMVALIGDALSKVGLNQQQRAAVEELGKKVSPKEQAVAEARDELKEELSEQLAKGKIEEKEFDDEIEELVSARMDASPVLRKALEDLHGILDEQQRKEFVDALTTAMQERATQAEGWFDELARDLKLTEDQKTKVHEVLSRAKPSLDQDRETAKRVFEAFKGEQFSIDEIVPMEEVGKRTKAKAKAMISIAKSLTEILTPAQLQQLARKIEPQEQEERNIPGQSPRQPGQEESEAGEQQEQQGPAGQQQEGPLGQQEQDFVVGGGYRRGGFVGGARGYRAGYGVGRVGGWGGGFYGGRMTVARGGYAAGYPFIGGYGVGVW